MSALSQACQESYDNRDVSDGCAMTELGEDNKSGRSPMSGGWGRQQREGMTKKAR